MDCGVEFINSEMSYEQRNSCPMCRANNPKKGAKEEIRRLKDWIAKGKAWAMTIMGDRYKKGIGVPLSYEKAVEMYARTCTHSDPNALVKLASMYVEGKGVPLSNEKAVELYKRAAAGGSVLSRLNLANMYRDGLGVQQSYEKAVEMYQILADEGDASAEANLGYMYIEGRGIEQSDELARVWWTKSAEQGYENAIQNLKRMNWHQTDEAKAKAGQREKGAALGGSVGTATTGTTTAKCSTCSRPLSSRFKKCTCLITQYCCNDVCQRNHWLEHKKEHRRICNAAKVKKKETES